MSYPFNVRVYGLLFDEEEKRILLSCEQFKEEKIIKFPGGGLQFGEGPEDCVVREFREELGINVTVRSHFYTTGFFQASAFDATEQVISIYYRVTPLEDPAPVISEQGGEEGFFWESLEAIGPDRFPLPIDRVVGDLLRKRFTSSG